MATLCSLLVFKIKILYINIANKNKLFKYSVIKSPCAVVINQH
jgi:hypothetical protein